MVTNLQKTRQFRPKRNRPKKRFSGFDTPSKCVSPNVFRCLVKSTAQKRVKSNGFYRFRKNNIKSKRSAQVSRGYFTTKYERKSAGIGASKSILTFFTGCQSFSFQAWSICRGGTDRPDAGSGTFHPAGAGGLQAERKESTREISAATRPDNMIDHHKVGVIFPCNIHSPLRISKF